MNSRFSFVLALCSALLVSGCTQMKESKLFGGGKPAVVKLAPLKEIKTSLNTKKVWEINTTSAMGESKIHPYIDSKTIFIAGADSASAHLTSNGKQLWKVQIGEKVTAGVNGTQLANPQGRKSVIASATQIFLGTNSGNAIALDAKSGEIQWIERLSSEVLSVSGSENGRVAFRTVDGKIHGLDSKTGELIWQRSQKTPALTQLGAGVPLIVSNMVVAGFANGKIAAYDLQTGQPLWEVILALPSGNSELEQMVDVDGRLKVLGNALFATSLNGSVAGINMEEGKQVWGRAFSSPNGLDVAETGVFSTDDKGNVWSLDPQSGGPIWSLDDLAGRQPSVPVLINNALFVVTDMDGNIHFLNTTDAKFRARHKGDLKGYSVEPTISGKSIYLFGKSGLLSKYTL